MGNSNNRRTVKSILLVKKFLELEVHWFESLTSLGDHLKTLQVEECFEREFQGERLSGKETKEVFIFLTKSVKS